MFRGSVNSNWKGGKTERKCLMCGDSFLRNSASKQKYCSRKCQGKRTSLRQKGIDNPLWKGGLEKLFCLLCGKDFMVSPCRKQSGKTQFCSKRCGNFWKNLHMKRKDTNIELLIENELKKRNLQYEKQKPIETIGIVDFLLPGKIIIQCDGDYWHGKKKVKNRDSNQDFLYGFKGYQIFRLGESRIKKSPSRCISQIIRRMSCLIKQE